MGFGKAFEEQVKPTERHNYVRYAAFKERMHAMRAAGNLKRDGATRAKFEQEFAEEVKRLSRFTSASLESVWMKIDSIHGELPADATDPKAQRISLYRIQDIEKGLGDLAGEIVSLHAFVRQNAAAFEKIAAKYDKLLREAGVRVPAASSKKEGSGGPGGKKVLDAADFEARSAEMNRLVETFLVLLSDLYARARRVKHNKKGGDAVWVPPESFQRKTTKYWVKAEDLLKVKFEIIKHLPLLIFGRKQGGKDSGGESLSFLASSSEELRDAQKISSVYYDSPDLHVYHNRLLRHDFASLVRVRWYVVLHTLFPLSSPPSPPPPCLLTFFAE